MENIKSKIDEQSVNGAVKYKLYLYWRTKKPKHWNGSLLTWKEFKKDMILFLLRFQLIKRINNN